MIRYPELLERTGKTRHQIDGLRKKYPLSLQPTRLGYYLFWPESSVDLILRLLSASEAKKN